MLRTRIIPVLLLQNSGLVKGSQFKNHKYVGDPINAVRIFNEKQVDELMFLDISATRERRGPNFDLISDITSEAFMPFAYGGGITSLDQIERLFAIGVEKVVVNSAAHHSPELIRAASQVAGSQAIVVSMDVKETLFGGYEVYVENGMRRTHMSPVDYAIRMQELGAGELVVCSISREGTGKGYDLKLISMVAREVEIPVVALGGARNLADMSAALKETAVSALAAGDMFVFRGKHKAVLITYPSYVELKAAQATRSVDLEASFSPGDASVAS